MHFINVCTIEQFLANTLSSSFFTRCAKTLSINSNFNLCRWSVSFQVGRRDKRPDGPQGRRDTRLPKEPFVVVFLKGKPQTQISGNDKTDGPICDPVVACAICMPGPRYLYLIVL